MAQTPEKDTIYIDVDEDITGIIDKLRGSDQKIVALVLPKRATVLQSIVNMKLLKRSAGELKKKVVLITSETGLLPIAGAVGLYVAKTLQSAPTIPDPPSSPGDLMETVESDSGEAEDVPIDKAAPIGKLAGLPAEPDDDDTIEVDSDKDEEAAEGAAAGAAAGKSAKKKDKKLKVPNFDSFRKKLFLVVGGLILLILLWILANKVLPKAKLTITTNSSNVSVTLPFTADASAKTVDEANNILPAAQKTFTKTDTQKVDSTGKKDNGTKASGTISAYNCTDTDVTVPAGTLFTSAGKSFSTNQAVAVPHSHATFSGSCLKDVSADVAVTATAAGDSYNLAKGASYTSNYASTLTGTGSAMTGGTSSIVKIVAQADIDAAKQQILDRNSEQAKAALIKQFQDDKSIAINDTFAVGTPAVTNTPNVGDQADSVTVNITISYTMVGVKNDDLKKIVENEIKKHIDTNKQTILNNGISSAQTSVVSKVSDTNFKVNLQTNAEAGAKQDATAIKKAVAGKKRGDTHDIITARPGVQDVKIDYSPFWVGGTPTRLSRITVIFVQPNGKPSTQQ